MLVPVGIKRRVEAKVEQSYKKAVAHYGREFKRPTVVYQKRGTTAGTAHGGTNTLDFNSTLLTENVEDFIERTVPHEVAHLIDYVVNPQNHHRGINWKGQRQKRVVHGADFRFIMERVLDADDSTRCHDYDVTRAQVRKSKQHEWKCDCCSSSMELGPKRHKKMLTNNKTYRPKGSRRGRGCSFDHTYSYVGVAGAAPPKSCRPRSHAWHFRLPS